MGNNLSQRLKQYDISLINSLYIYSRFHKFHDQFVYRWLLNVWDQRLYLLFLSIWSSKTENEFRPQFDQIPEQGKVIYSINFVVSANLI